MIFFYEFLLYNIRVEEDFMIKLFACDLDGTLLNDDHEFDEIIFNAIDAVIKEATEEIRGIYSLVFIYGIQRNV